MTTSQEMDQQYASGDVERRLKDIERKLNAYDEAGMGRLVESGIFQVEPISIRLDKDGQRLLAQDSGDSVSESPNANYIRWVRDRFDGTPLAEIFGGYTTPGATDISQLILRALSDDMDFGAVSMGVWSESTASWLPRLQLSNVLTSANPPLVVGTAGTQWLALRRTDDDNFQLMVRSGGTLVDLGGDGTEKTISSGGIVITSGYHRIDTEADAATDDLTTILGGGMGQLLTLRAENGARDVVVKDGTGNLQLEGDCTLNNVQDTITLIYDSNLTAWLEVARSNNGA
jgi:hypothetical protein